MAEPKPSPSIAPLNQEVLSQNPQASIDVQPNIADRFGEFTIFSKKASTQDASRLTQLPDEILIKILRNLHKNNQLLSPISSTQDDVDVTSARAVVRLSAQLMRTCQKLYHLSHSILYDENILEVLCIVKADYCGLDSPAKLKILSLNTRFEIREECLVLDKDLILHALDLDNIKATQTKQSLKRVKAFLDYYPRITNIRNVLCRFVFRLVDQGHLGEIGIAVMLLKEFLRKKNVTSDLSSVFPTGADSHPATTTRIKQFCGLRCRSVELTGLPDLEGLSEKVMHTKSIIMSKEPFRNPFEEYIDLVRFLGELPKLSAGDRVEDRLWIMEQFAGVQNRAILFDHDGVRSTIKRLVKSAKRQYEAEWSKAASGVNDGLPYSVEEGWSEDEDTVDFVRQTRCIFQECYQAAGRVWKEIGLTTVRRECEILGFGSQC